jgi:uncharacterized OB-fold protein
VSNSYLAPGLPAPEPAPDGLDAPFWQGLGNDEIRIQHCRGCEKWQWGPEWICHHCHSDDLSFRPVAGHGVIYSYERVWHPVHPALQDQGPYLVVLVELTGAPGVRLVGNLLGDPHQAVQIGATVGAVFEHHLEADPPFSLLQWVVTAH